MYVFVSILSLSSQKRRSFCKESEIYIYIYIENVVSYLFYSAVIESGKKFSRLHFYISSMACFHFSILERYSTYKSQYLFFCHNICILKLNERIKLFFFISKNRSYYYKSLATGLCLLQIQRSRYIHTLLNCD